MKSTKKGPNFRVHLLAALLSAFLIDLFGNRFGIAMWLFVYFSSNQPIGHPETAMLMYGLTLGLNLLAGLPALWLLKYQGVRHYSVVTMLAVAEASLLFFVVSSVIRVSGWIWLLVMLGLLLVSYYLADRLYNKWTTSDERKTVATLIILGATVTLFAIISLS